MYDEVIVLIAERKNADMAGDIAGTTEEREVFAEVRSVGGKETYLGFGVDLKPELVFVLADYMDYEGQSEIRYNGLIYQVIRNYRKGTELGLVVSRYGFA